MPKRKLFVEMKSKQWSNEDIMKRIAHYALPRAVEQATPRNPKCWAISSLPFPDFPKTRSHTSEYRVTSELKTVETHFRNGNYTAHERKPVFPSV